MGIVEEVGRDVRSLAAGDRVVIPFNIACGHCFFCRRGLQSQCETTQNKTFKKGGSLFGYTEAYGGVPGGQAEYLRVPLADYGPIKIPQEPPDERFLYLSDVLPTAWQGVRYAQVSPGDTVGVWGLGPIGQMCVRVALHHGAGRAIGIDRVAERLAMARRHGADAIDFKAVDDITEAIWDLTDGRGLVSGIDAVGMEAEGSTVDSVLQATKLRPDRLGALETCLASIRRGGTCSILGVYGGWFPMFPLGDLMDKQITLRMGQANVRRWTDEIMPLLSEDDPLGTADLGTHLLPLEQAAHGYEIFQKKQDGAIKVILKP